MKSRKKLSRNASKKIFKNGATQRKENKVNTNARGGFRLWTNTSTIYH